ncbi:phosphoserine transaminase [Motiliproteus sp. MSK22-1]|nr:phosphoserine transaminase [Motiliproteus sp. MSK22-1]
MMPPTVLKQAQAEMLDWNGTGISVWEMPFTGQDFQAIADQARQDLRELLNIPDHYRILFMQGGASAQFSLVPLNLLLSNPKTGADPKADYIETGYWSRKAIIEGSRYCQINIAASGRSSDFIEIPSVADWRLNTQASYCHITSNETANGLQYSELPNTGHVPLVVDMTSDFLSRPIDFQGIGLLYAGAQKNIGPAGLCIVIVREDLIREPLSSTPSAFSYQVIEQNNGRFNTPLTYGIYLAGLVLKYFKAQGGLSEIQSLNKKKSNLLYEVIDNNPFYHCAVSPAYRSQMNPCFTLVDAELTDRFVAQAGTRGLINLKGHSAKGGIRASLYNAMPLSGVLALADFMAEFAEGCCS